MGRGGVDILMQYRSAAEHYGQGGGGYFNAVLCRSAADYAVEFFWTG